MKFPQFHTLQKSFQIPLPIHIPIIISQTRRSINLNTNAFCAEKTLQPVANLLFQEQNARIKIQTRPHYR